MVNTSRTEPIRLGGDEIGNNKSFTYLGSIMDTTGGTIENNKIRIGKDKIAYILLQKICSRELSRPIKLQYI